MDILTKLKINDFISKNIDLFEVFESAYLFGSILNESNFCNDIDIFLTYTDYSLKIRDAIKLIIDKIEEEFKLTADITALSSDEENEVRFLKRIEPKYLKIK